MAMMPSPESLAAADDEWINQSLMNYDAPMLDGNEHLMRASTSTLTIAEEAPSPTHQHQHQHQHQNQNEIKLLKPSMNYNYYVNSHAYAYAYAYARDPEFHQMKMKLIKMKPELVDLDEKLLARALQNTNLLLPFTPFPSPTTTSMHPSLPPPPAFSDLWAMPSFLTEHATVSTSTSTSFGTPLQGACINQSKVPSLLSGVTGKRGININSILQNGTSQSHHQHIPRKSRLEPCSPFSTSLKARKEKLGDRIAALQQLVAPFGKTDTASVLMEAIGYIKFLQDQVETLSVPYMRLPKIKRQRTNQEEEASEKGEEEASAKADLRSRGLCLVPLSCTSYVTQFNF